MIFTPYQLHLALCAQQAKEEGFLALADTIKYLLAKDLQT